MYYYVVFSCYGDHRDLHVLTHSFPTRRSSDLPRDAEGLRRLKAMGFSDKRLAYLALQSANLQPGTRTATARGSGLIHEAVKAMTGGVTEAEVRALRHKDRKSTRLNSSH